MNIRYNQIAGRFEAEFSTDFQGDLAAVKGAGFRTDGPPTWCWWTAKLPALNKLRENKPISGLTISEEAYQTYVRLSEIEAKNAEIRAQFAPIAEEQKRQKKAKQKEESKVAVIIPHKPNDIFNYIGAEDLPPMPPFELKNPPQPHTGPYCIICQAPVYFYELQDPPTCLWCELQMDKNKA